MTKEELKKEAEEYATRDVFFGSVSESVVNPQRKEDWQKGAEFGYQKGFKLGVKSNEWHFVKDGDLPNTKLGMADVTVAYINVYENLCRKDCCFDGTNFVYWNDRNPAGWKNVSTFGRIYAWKYLEKLPDPPRDEQMNGGEDGSLYMTFSDEELEQFFLTAVEVYEKNKR